MKPRFKILNKSTDGIILNFPKKGSKKLTWEQFNEKYVIVDNTYAEWNDDELARQAETRPSLQYTFNVWKNKIPSAMAALKDIAILKKLK